MGFAKLILICLSLLVAGVVQASNLETSHHSRDPSEGNWVELQGENAVVIPNVTLSRSALSWTYPYNRYPIYHQNQTVSGTFFGSKDLANGTIELRTAPISSTSFLASVDVLDDHINLTDASPASAPLKLNYSGDAHFSFPAMPTGIYAVYVTSDNSSSVLSASPVLIAEKEVVVEAPQEVRAGDILPVRVTLKDGSDSYDLHYGAFMVSAEDYRGLSLNLTGDGTLDGTLIKVTWNEEELDIEGDFDVGWDLLARLLLIFPMNSAAALQDSADGEAELNMITEDGWKPGSYVLTCCVISEDAMVGLNQTEVVII
jgi:methanogen extracellular protein (TIGR04279 family)